MLELLLELQLELQLKLELHLQLELHLNSASYKCVRRFLIYLGAFDYRK